MTSLLIPVLLFIAAGAIAVARAFPKKKKRLQIPLSAVGALEWRKEAIRQASKGHSLR